jgi:protein gp37
VGAEEEMSDTTAISWCDATFNPWWGCSKVSPACDHCYAERDAHRFAPGRTLWGVGSERRTFGDAHWQAPLKWARTMPAKLGRRPRVFCASMGDWLDLDAPMGQFVRLLHTIMDTPELDWLLLSKRIGNWRKRLEYAREHSRATNADESLPQWIDAWLDGRAPANVVLMSTVINQEEADRDVAKLLAIPAWRRGLSIEPMLGPIELRQRGYFNYCERPDRTGRADGTHVLRPPLDWVIAGGESGPHARPAHPDWFKSLRDQCAAAGVPFHFKQWGEWSPDDPGESGPRERDVAGVLPSGDAALYSQGYVAPFDSTERLRANGLVRLDGRFLMSRVGKAAAGRLLDGIEHNGFPV